MESNMEVNTYKDAVDGALLTKGLAKTLTEEGKRNQAKTSLDSIKEYIIRRSNHYKLYHFSYDRDYASKSYPEHKLNSNISKELREDLIDAFLKMSSIPSCNQQTSFLITTTKNRKDLLIGIAHLIPHLFYTITLVKEDRSEKSGFDMDSKPNAQLSSNFDNLVLERMTALLFD